MEKSSHVCRLCQSLVAYNRSVALFSRGSVQQQLSTRIADLLDVNVDSSDCLPQHVCWKCKRRVEVLENAAQDLVDFRNQAKAAYIALLPSKGAVKRVKESSGDVGVSPDIAKARPPSIRATIHSKRLHFGQSDILTTVSAIILQ